MFSRRNPLVESWVTLSHGMFLRVETTPTFGTGRAAFQGVNCELR